METTSFPELKALAHLSPEAKSSILRAAILRFVKEHPEGVTAVGVAEAVDIDYHSVRKHLDFLTATRQIYTHAYGPRNVVFFPNGRLSHPHAEAQVPVNGQTFRLSLLKNPQGEFLYIQELKRTAAEGEHIAGGIIIRKESIDTFLLELHKFLEPPET